VRMDKESFADGWVVLRHWAGDEFLSWSFLFYVAL
jgi:hypothetical protein